MSTHKNIDRVCILAVVIALLICTVFMNGEAIGIQVLAKEMGYESRLFDTSRVHTIDIVIDDWDAFLQTCQSEEYSSCSVVIDGESYSNVGIRGKGNTSLTTVSSMNSDRYSFKIEFDQYDSTKSYYGLDKLSLNNLIQDNTMMKDYLTYQMMNEFGVAAPLCSYVYITVNGEEWGLYLAVEAVEDSFLQRNYGSNYGELYKPDSMSMGGGRGNGMNFAFEDVTSAQDSEGSTGSTMPSAQRGQMMPSGQDSQMREFDPSAMGGMDLSQMDGNIPQQMPESFDRSNMGGMGMGSSDVKLQYVDDDPASYSSILDNAKTDVTEADQQRLIASLQALSSGENIASTVDVEAVIRYFVVHNFVVNGDSYTGSMVHNYYLYEEDGRLSMIPWDYNLAFGTFQGGDANSAVNDAIDAPLSVSGSGDRPMMEWILNDERYTELYHQYFREFLDGVDVSAVIDKAAELIAPYVEKDPTKFCTYEEFEAGVQTLKAFCGLRAQSVAAQLDGKAAIIDASAITLSDMGTMGSGMGGRVDFQMPQEGMAIPEVDMSSMPDGTDGMQMPEQSGMQQIPMQGGLTDASNASQTSGESQQFPGNMQLPEGMEIPEGMEDRFQERNGTAQAGFTDLGQANTVTAQGTSQWLLLGVTFLVLLAGLLFAFLYKR